MALRGILCRLKTQRKFQRGQSSSHEACETEQNPVGISSVSEDTYSTGIKSPSLSALTASHFNAVKDEAGATLAFSYCHQIPQKQQNQQLVDTTKM
ncbi:uncharacterized protein V6R79_001979 [Siganus canaliculatus]